MMRLEHVVAALLTDRRETEGRADALRAAGADVRTCESALDLATLVRIEVIDVVVVALSHRGGELADVLGVLREEPRARSVPTLILVPRDATLADLSAKGEAACVLDSAAPGFALVEAVARLLEPISRVKELVEERSAMSEKLAARAASFAAVRKATRVLAHDVGTHLGIVVGFASNLRDQIVGPLTPPQHQHVLRVLDATNAATHLLADHTNSELFASEAVTERRPSKIPRFGRRMLLDVGTLAEQTAQLLSDVARQAGVTLSSSSEGSIHVWGDGTQLKQVMVNLVVNALKFTPRGGEVTIAVRPLTPSAGDGVGARRGCEVVVSDTGLGVPVEDRERIFGYGVRLARDASVTGSGVGLAVVRELIGLHGGTVRVEDTPKGGAAFIATLPIDRRERSDPQDESLGMLHGEDGAP